MAPAHGDLVLGDVVVIPFEKRHIYTYIDTQHSVRECKNCDLSEDRPFPRPAVEHEKPCPNNKGGDK